MTESPLQLLPPTQKISFPPHKNLISPVVTWNGSLKSKIVSKKEKKFQQENQSIFKRTLKNFLTCKRIDHSWQKKSYRWQKTFNHPSSQKFWKSTQRNYLISQYKGIKDTVSAASRRFFGISLDRLVILKTPPPNGCSCGFKNI